jgi:acyl dehydratase
MPIDRNLALGAALGETAGGYGPDDVILYHLGVGAGFRATDASELEYTFEKNLKVLPSFAVVAASGMTARARREQQVARSPQGREAAAQRGEAERSVGGLGNVPGLAFNPALLLHGEQDVEIHRPLPTAAEFTSRGRIAEIYDKGKAALVIVEYVASDEDGPLFTNRMSLFLRGEGGFDGPSGPKAGNEKPERRPDGVVESVTLPQQALLYRLNGDKNPLHADPEFAKMGGFDKPIIHGLCSFGIACKAVVDAALDGDPSRVARYAARFAGVAFPGETYLTSWWRQDSRLLIDVQSKERGAPIITNAAFTLR